MHFLAVMFHSGPVRLGEEWGGPSKIKVVFTGVNPTSVLEIRAEVPRSRRGNLLLIVRDKPNYKPYWGLIVPQ